MSKILITSGGTKVPIDRVRHIGNMSRGTFGSRIGTVALQNGHEVCFLAQKDSKTPFTLNYDLYQCEDLVAVQKGIHDLLLLQTTLGEKYTQRTFKTPQEYTTVLKTAIVDYSPDIIILAAAVSDYNVKNYVDGEIRSNSDLVLELEPLEKTIGQVKTWCPHCVLVGFKLLVGSTKEELIDSALLSIKNNRCDVVVANDLADIQHDDHRVYIVSQHSVVTYAKSDSPNDPLYLARKVIDEVI
jgi:phosphopantothenate-cysteine ligase